MSSPEFKQFWMMLFTSALNSLSYCASGSSASVFICVKLSFLLHSLGNVFLLFYFVSAKNLGVAEFLFPRTLLFGDLTFDISDIIGSLSPSVTFVVIMVGVVN